MFYFVNKLTQTSTTQRIPQNGSPAVVPPVSDENHQREVVEWEAVRRFSFRHDSKNSPGTELAVDTIDLWLLVLMQFILSFVDISVTDAMKVNTKMSNEEIRLCQRKLLAPRL